MKDQCLNLNTERSRVQYKVREVSETQAKFEDTKKVVGVDSSFIG